MTLGASRVATAQVPTWDWAFSPAGGIGLKPFVDAAGNVYTTGSFSGTATFGSISLTSVGSSDIFVAKRTPGGVYEWAVSGGGSKADVGTGLTVDSIGNAYITGYIGHDTINFAQFGNKSLSGIGASDVIVAKVNVSGVWQWATRAGGRYYDAGKNILLDRHGILWVSGAFDSTAVFGTTTLVSAGMSSISGGDIFIARLTTTGDWLDAIRAGGTGSDNIGGMALDGAGNVYVSGSFYGPTIEFGPLTLTNAGGTADLPDIFVAKLSATGTWQWATSAGGPNRDLATGLALDAAGNTYLTGYFTGAAAQFGAHSVGAAGPPTDKDVYVAQADANGVWQWVARAGGTSADGAEDIALDATGGVYLTGYFQGAMATFGTTTLANTATPSTDIFVAKLSTAGAWQWGIGAGGTGTESGRGIAVAGTGHVVVTGHTFGQSLTFGTHTVAASTGLSSFTAQLAQSPTGLPTDAAEAVIGLFPNPACAAARLTGTPSATATLLDALGRTVRTVAFASGTAELDLTGLSSGVYTVRAGTQARQLVVE